MVFWIKRVQKVGMCGRVDRLQIKADIRQDGHLAVFFIEFDGLCSDKCVEALTGMERE